MPTQLCKFWAQGTCKYGGNCRFEHPQRAYYDANRYSALQAPDSSQSRGKYSSDSSAARNVYRLDKDAIRIDLSTETPQWILSAYGPVREAPEQLFGGPLREQSFEEMRLRHYDAVAAGTPQQAVEEAQNLYNEAENQMKTALNNLDGAVNYICSAENTHPNRLDICKASTGNPILAKAGFNAFGQASGSSQSHVSQPDNRFVSTSQPSTATAFGASTGAAANGAFGRPSMSAQQPNQIGVPPGSTAGAFGQPSALGWNSNVFGAPSTSPAGAFGQPSESGQKSNPFGLPSASSTVAAFSQPSAFGGESSSFGAPSHLGAAGAFGRPSSLGQKLNPFDKPSAASALVPGTTSAPAASSSTPNANPLTSQREQTHLSFGGIPGAQINPFGHGQPQVQAPNPFGQPSGQTSNVFVAATATAAANERGVARSSNAPIGDSRFTQAISPFGTSLNAPNVASNTWAPTHSNTTPSETLGFQAPKPNPFGIHTAGPNTSGSSLQGSMVAMNTDRHVNQTVNGGMPDGDPANVTSYTSKGPDGRLNLFKGMRVQYKNNVPGAQSRDGKWEKIWFPEGAPKHDTNTEFGEDLYDDATKRVYIELRSTRSFPEGLMPMLPPKREWCFFDF